jgi:rubrerythrin
MKLHNGTHVSNGERMNRTGAAVAPPELFQSLVEGTSTSEPSGPGDETEIAAVRIAYAKRAEPTGHVPAPHPEQPSKAEAAAAPALLSFTDLLGERLAFERAGVRLYDALLSKHDAYGSWKGGPSRSDLEEIRADELGHFLLLNQTAQDLGADPTAVTPSANLQAVLSKGWGAALADPRTDLKDGLEVVLAAELVDNDCWETLSDFAAGLGRGDLVQAFADAVEDERDHLRRVRAWLGNAFAAKLGEAGGEGAAGNPFQRRANQRDRLMVEALREGEEPSEAQAARAASTKAPRARSTTRNAASGAKKTAGARMRGKAAKAPARKTGTATNKSNKTTKGRAKARSKR